VVSTAVPIFIGDAKEYVKVFDRKKLTIKNSDVATVGSGNNVINAFENDMTIFRGIERLDVKVKDADALVYGTLTLGE
jgi:HK97 family phage major capsid protein